MHCFDSNKALEEAWLKLYKNAVGIFEQILEVALYKIAVVRTLTFDLTNHLSKMSKICWILWGNLEWIHEWHSLMDSYIWTHQYWLTSKNGLLVKLVRVKQRDPYGKHALMINYKPSNRIFFYVLIFWEAVKMLEEQISLP